LPWGFPQGSCFARAGRDGLARGARSSYQPSSLSPVGSTSIMSPLFHHRRRVGCGGADLVQQSEGARGCSVARCAWRRTASAANGSRETPYALVYGANRPGRGVVSDRVPVTREALLIVAPENLTMMCCWARLRITFLSPRRLPRLAAMGGRACRRDVRLDLIAARAGLHSAYRPSRGAALRSVTAAGPGRSPDVVEPHCRPTGLGLVKSRGGD